MSIKRTREHEHIRGLTQGLGLYLYVIYVIVYTIYILYYMYMVISG